MKNRPAVHLVCTHSDSGEDSIDIDQCMVLWHVVLPRWTQRSARVQRPLHLSSYPNSNGPASVMALWGVQQDYCDLSHTLNPPLWNCHTDTYTSPHSHWQVLLTAEGSVSMVICLQGEEQENRLQENNKNTTELLNMAVLFASTLYCTC